MRDPRDRAPSDRSQSRAALTIKGKILRVLLILLGIGLSAAFAYPLYIVPLLDRHFEQDRCSFGAVSNARYRELLARARWLRWTDWTRLGSGAIQARSSRPEPRDVRLAERFRDVSEGMTSVQERVAAVRAMGAIYVDDTVLSGPLAPGYKRAPHAFDVAPEVAARPGSGTLVFLQYRAFEWSNLARGCLFLLRCTTDYFSTFQVAEPDVHLKTRDAVSERLDQVQRANEFSFSHRRPSLKDGSNLPFQQVNGLNCPPVPSETWQQNYLDIFTRE